MAKILLACHQFFPRFYTGTEVLTLECADELKREGHEVAIVTFEPWLPGDPEVNLEKVVQHQYCGHEVWKVYAPSPSSQVKRLDYESFDKRLSEIFSKVLDEIQPDVVHAFHLMRLTLSFVEEVKKRSLPLYLTITDFWLTCPTYQLIRYNGELCRGPRTDRCFSCLASAYASGMDRPSWKFKAGIAFPKIAASVNGQARACQKLLGERIRRTQRIIAKADGVFFPNSFIQSLFHENDLTSSNESILSFPLPKRAEKLLEMSLPSCGEELRIAFIGTLRETKGPQVLIKACTSLENKRISLELWGKSETEVFEKNLRTLAAGHHNIKFCGTFPQEEFPEVLKKIHVVVVPSIWYENTPLTALSALAAERLLIVSDLGGLSSLVENEISGFTFPPGDHVALAQIISYIADNPDIMVSMSSRVNRPITITEYVQRLLLEYEKNVVG